MLPTIDIGPFHIWSFGPVMALAFLVGALLGARQARYIGVDPYIAFDIIPWAAVGGLLGAKLLSVLVHLDVLAVDPVGAFVRSGMVWYGGLIGGIAAAAWRFRRSGLPFSLLFDYGAAPVMLAHAVGRIGCFLVGDDYGMPTDSWLGIAFPNGLPPSTAGYLRASGASIAASIPDAQVMRVHPTQLYEVAGGIVIFAILWIASRRGLGAWKVFALYAGLYGVERFLLEAIRPKDDRILWGFTVSQAISAALVAVAVWLWARRSAPAPLPSAPSSRGRAVARAIPADAVGS